MREDMGSISRKLKITFKKSPEEKSLADQLVKELGVAYPLYLQCYQDAMRAVLDHIDSNVLTEKESGTEVYGYKRDRYGLPLNANNIIAFMGDRGAGKTTATTEFARILAEYDQHVEIWNRELYGSNGVDRHYSFYVLPSIDASVLDAKEDLIEVILANMYHVLDEKWSGYGKESYERDRGFQKLIRSLDDVYREYLNVGQIGRMERKERIEDSLLVKLRDVSDSVKLRASIEKLTEEYLGVLGDGRQDVDRSFMVVTVDDLDMNPGSGFEMLDQLYKYFANRRVIILVAVKYEQLHLLSEKKFVDDIIPEYGSTHYIVYEKAAQKASRLTDDYLLKALSLANRIYLPVRGKLQLETEVEQEGFYKYELKGFLLKKIAAKTDIYYDAKGLKKHFCLPDTVRELVTYVAFLDSLHTMDEIEKADPEKQMLLYDQNHERFNEDIEKRMSVEKLDDDQLVLYNQIMERRVERRAGYMYCFLQNWRKSKKQYTEKMFVDSVEEQVFGYTDLIQVLYKMGREDYADKALVHCILASFTSEMVREYYSYRHNKDEKARERAAVRLGNFLGTTFGGKWLSMVMPQMTMGSDISNCGSGNLLQVCYLEKVSALQFKITQSEKIQKRQKARKWLIDVLAENLPYVECISLMMTSAWDAAGRRVVPAWEIHVNQREKSEVGKQAVLTIQCSVQDVRFDMFGFLGREVRQDGTSRHDEKLFEAFGKCVEEYCAKHGMNSEKESMLQEWKQRAETCSIWCNENSELTFPYFNFDMAYNVVKRARKKIAESGNIICENEICDYYQKVYGYMAYFLKEETDYYVKELELERTPDFFGNFMKSPFIRAFGICSKGNEKRETEGTLREENEGLEVEGTLRKEKMNQYLLDTIKSLQIIGSQNKEAEMLPD